jgi:hypothetical protein
MYGLRKTVVPALAYSESAVPSLQEAEHQAGRSARVALHGM